ncbi:MAG TPA: hypothetical protein VM010_08815, partial [Chitinophagaceae bacterium]|nr:hypothetical protein [Chitinophagaceae bacterium]
MKNAFYLFLLLSFFCSTTFAQLRVAELRCENKNNPTGIAVLQPRLSWQLISPDRNVLQTAYELRTASDLASLKSGKNIKWASGKIASD